MRAEARFGLEPVADADRLNSIGPRGLNPCRLREFWPAFRVSYHAATWRFSRRSGPQIMSSPGFRVGGPGLDPCRLREFRPRVPSSKPCRLMSSRAGVPGLKSWRHLEIRAGVQMMPFPGFRQLSRTPDYAFPRNFGRVADLEPGRLLESNQSKCRWPGGPMEFSRLA